MFVGGDAEIKDNKCWDAMKPRQDAAEKLRVASFDLPPLYRRYLKPAAGELKLCVSCIADAKAYCHRVSLHIERMREAAR